MLNGLAKTSSLNLLAPVAVKSGKGAVRGFFGCTGLLLTSSAALGGIAVAIWNRRSLVRMRQQIDASTASASRECPGCG